LNKNPKPGVKQASILAFFGGGGGKNPSTAPTKTNQAASPAGIDLESDNDDNDEEPSTRSASSTRGEKRARAVGADDEERQRERGAVAVVRAKAISTDASMNATFVPKENKENVSTRQAAQSTARNARSVMPKCTEQERGMPTTNCTANIDVLTAPSKGSNPRVLHQSSPAARRGRTRRGKGARFMEGNENCGTRLEKAEEEKEEGVKEDEIKEEASTAGRRGTKREGGAKRRTDGRDEMSETERVEKRKEVAGRGQDKEEEEKEEEEEEDD
jgi:hypothetical protein